MIAESRDTPRAPATASFARELRSWLGPFTVAESDGMGEREKIKKTREFRERRCSLHIFFPFLFLLPFDDGKADKDSPKRGLAGLSPHLTES